MLSRQRPITQRTHAHHNNIHPRRRQHYFPFALLFGCFVALCVRFGFFFCALVQLVSLNRSRRSFAVAASRSACLLRIIPFQPLLRDGGARRRPRVAAAARHCFMLCFRSSTPPPHHSLSSSFISSSFSFVAVRHRCVLRTSQHRLGVFFFLSF